MSGATGRGSAVSSRRTPRCARDCDSGSSTSGGPPSSPSWTPLPPAAATRRCGPGWWRPVRGSVSSGRSRSTPAVATGSTRATRCSTATVWSVGSSSWGARHRRCCCSSTSASSVFARVAGSLEQGRVDGNGLGPLQLTLLSQNAQLHRGDALVSLGSPGGVPYVPEVPIGVVRRVLLTPGALTRSAVIRSYVDFSALDIVAVVVKPPPRVRRDAVLPPSPTPSPAPLPTPSGSPSPGQHPKSSASPSPTP